MITNRGDVNGQHAERAQREVTDTILRGCKGLIERRGGFRGGLGDLGAALAEHVGITFPLTVTTLRKHADNLRAHGIAITCDDGGRDVEIAPVSKT